MLNEYAMREFAHLKNQYALLGQDIRHSYYLSDKTKETEVEEIEKYISAHSCRLREVSIGFKRWPTTLLQPIGTPSLDIDFDVSLNQKEIKNLKIFSYIGDNTVRSFQESIGNNESVYTVRNMVSGGRLLVLEKSQSGFFGVLQITIYQKFIQSMKKIYRKIKTEVIIPRFIIQIPFNIIAGCDYTKMYRLALYNVYKEARFYQQSLDKPSDIEPLKDQTQTIEITGPLVELEAAKDSSSTKIGEARIDLL